MFGRERELRLLLFCFSANTSDFIAQQLQAMTSLQAEREAHAKEMEKRKLSRPRQQAQIPAIPEIPEVPPVPPLPPK